MRSWLKTSFIDYPGKIASVFFYGGCNFRCPFCQNVDLVLKPANNSLVAENEVIAKLKAKRHLYDGVCITGGEPLLVSNIREIISQIKAVGVLVKIDTNGSKPNVLKDLVENDLIDYVAMDIKTSPKKYYQVFKKQKPDERLLNDIIESVNYLKNQDKVKYEFRSTIYPPYFQDEDLPEIAKLVTGALKYVLQQFDNRETLMDTTDIFPFSNEKLIEMKNYFSEFVVECQVRN